MTVTRRDSEHHTYGDYLKWSREFGDELIDGAAYVREPPAPAYSHQGIVRQLCLQAANALDGTFWEVCVSPLDVRLPKSHEQDDQVETVLQPDLFVVGDLSKIDRRGVRGAPDWVAEVLSPSTARYDRNLKIPAYECAGVPEVWLISPMDLTAAIYSLKDGQYGRPITQKLKGKTPVAAVPGVVIDWDRLLAKVRFE